MLIVVNASNRHEYGALIADMHRQRKRVFIDSLGWTLDSRDGQEVDAFDASASYLLSVEDGALVASLRFLPTTDAHLLSEHFPWLCDAGVPQAPGIMEVSRFCVSPDIRAGVRRTKALGRLVTGCIEYALLSGAASLTFILGLKLSPYLLRIGWDMRPLGLSRDVDGDSVCAWQLAITPETLRLVANHYKVALPQLRIPDAVSEAA